MRMMERVTHRPTTMRASCHHCAVPSIVTSVKAFACELVCAHACAFVGLATLANTTLTVDDSECNSDDEEDDDEALEKAEA